MIITPDVFAFPVRESSWIWTLEAAAVMNAVPVVMALVLVSITTRLPPGYLKGINRCRANR
jgi:hypothetical protein